MAPCKAPAVTDADGENLNNVDKIKKRPTPYNTLTRKKKKELKKKIADRIIKKDEYKHYEWDRRFTNRRNRGVKRFWSAERKRLLAEEKETRNWVKQQKEDIISNRTPYYNGEAI
ncbi:MAG: hypothetical protein AB9856_06605 [Cellulosilyticaceae bacterium]